MRIAIVGTSGAVGQELLKILQERQFPLEELVLFGSERSAGKAYEFRGKEYIVKCLQDNDDFKNIDIAFTSAGSGVSVDFANVITRYGTMMIDNSNAFRMETDVPLVVPEVNAKDALNAPRNIIANPNCTTIQLVVSLQPIHQLSPIKKVRVATYQASSGAGAKGMLELEQQAKAFGKSALPPPQHFSDQLLFNLIPQVDIFMDNDYTKEEMKMYNETRKIMHADIKTSATCVRVPVMRAHSESIWVETEDILSNENIVAAWESAPRITYMDDPKNGIYPKPLHIAGKDDVYIGRLRRDLAEEKGITFWSVSDQIRKGAALNAIQIAEYILKNK